MELKEAIEKLHAVFGRNNVDIGKFDIIDRDEPVTTNQLDAFYQLTSFEHVLTIGGEFFLNIQPEIKLKEAQEGWYFILDKEGEMAKDDLKWNENWVVFANRNDDAIYYDKTDGYIYGSVDKKIFFCLSSSLSDFFYILSECMEIEEKKYGFNTTDAEEETSSIFIDDIREFLSRKLNDKQREDFIAFFFG
ncbi:Uncharacterised protein [Porphyromonas macacae]|uniref:SMI1/KNR4 family protein n=1 Tax=Porphyromonas macacae TaxID=28115 RepID=A0A379E7N6_9PORP|nr:hypothetical protein [Porphyromonas macacae]SUB88705.1 Uncharacterised protein [Porphyromonas macacae]